MSAPTKNINLEKAQGNLTASTITNGNQSLGSAVLNLTGSSIFATLSATTYFSGATTLNTILASGNYLSKTGGTITGGLTGTTISDGNQSLNGATLKLTGTTSVATFTATTIYSGSSELNSLLVSNRTIYTQWSSTTVGNTAASTTLFSTSGFTGTKTLGANFFTPGKFLKIRLGGNFGYLSGNVGIRLQIGSLDASRAITPSATGDAWEVDIYTYCKNAGTGGTVNIRGIMKFETTDGTWAQYDYAFSDVTLNTTISNDIDIEADFSIADGSNNITCDYVVVE